MSLKKTITLLLTVCAVSACTLYAGDPTRPDIAAPKIATAKKFNALRLSMIQTGTEQKRAIINGKSVMVGDQIGGYQVKYIKTSEVILQNSKGQVRLSLITKGTIRKKS